jgi:tRNA-specific 2-thiouridylase
MHWINPGDNLTQAMECTVKTRYRQGDLSCTIRLNLDDHRTKDEHWRVTLNRPARAVTPGQYAVFYRGERCLGGGIIAAKFNSELGAGLAAPSARRITYNSLLSAEGS